MKSILKVLALAAVASASLFAAPAQAEQHRLTVVELFTSQGCSSCPPADAFLGDLSARRDVLTLSFHVDYWDYIGWKDPFASPRHTQRQRDYARQFDLRYVYTPQMVIQGADQAVGSDRGAVLEKVASPRNKGRVKVSIRPDRKKGDVLIGIGGGVIDGEADVVLVIYDKQHVTSVKRGENSGRTITNSNVVRSMRTIATWTGEAMTIPATLGDLAADGGDACAVLLQSKKTRRILGAARMDLVR